MTAGGQYQGKSTTRYHHPNGRNTSVRRGPRLRQVVLSSAAQLGRGAPFQAWESGVVSIQRDPFAA